MKYRAVAIWLVFIALCIFVVSRVQIGADLSAFLPRSPTPAQQLLTEQLRDGVVSRLILVGIEGGTPDALAQTSKRLAQRLGNERSFSLVNNGEESRLAGDQAFLLENRYLLSPAVTPERFTAEGLHASLENALQLLGSPAGMLLKRVIPRDPSGEMLQLLEGFSGQSQPPTHEGVWLSRDGKRALLLVQTSAPGFDIDAQQQAIALIRSAFAEASRGTELSGQHLLLSGPGVFSVQARASIKDVALYFSVITAILVSILLLLVYRSWRVLAISLLPVVSGALAGIAAVSLGYGVVYGITLGFGITLIGEAVDYAIYFFTRLTPGKPPGMALGNIWPTLRLGVLTTVCGFSPMFLAGFPGLAQLGLFSVIGLIVAVLVTRWVLPSLVPANFATHPPAPMSAWVMRLIRQAPLLRPLVLVAVIAATLFIALHRGPLWSDSLSSLSPVTEADQRLDEALRRDLGAPDVRYMVIVSGKDREAVLERSEAVGAKLDVLINKNYPTPIPPPTPPLKGGANIAAVPAFPPPLQGEGWGGDGLNSANGQSGINKQAQTNQPILTGYDTPARYLPSLKTQRARLAALPETATLRANLKQALAGLPFRPEVFEPFFNEVATTRSRALLTPADLQGTNLGLQTESLLARRNDGWTAMLPLRGVTDTRPIRQALAQQDGNPVLLDLKQESDALYQMYVHEAVILSAAGALAIVLLLFASLRSPRRVAAVLLPLAAAVVITTAIVLAGGQKLLIFHLVGLLLAVAVGSNYSLFFERESFADKHDEDSQRTMVSLLVANLSTTIGFGMLAFSGVPVLTSIGSTVAIGAFLSLLFSAVLMGRKVAG